MLRVPDAGQPAWLVLAVDGPGGQLGQLVDDVRVGVVTSHDSFALALRSAAPRIVVVGSPPATARDLALVIDERRRRAGLRAVLLNAPDAVAERLAALDVGFDEALPSTVSAAELAGRLRVLGRRRNAPPARAIPVTEHVELDLHARELRRDGVTVHLRPREYQLLALLATHPRRAYSRRDLISRVWGTAYHGDVRTVDVHVRWLRSKIEEDPDRPAHLVTVYGVGYRLDPPMVAADARTR